MPWCDHCARFWNPGSLPAEGTCPTCGRRVDAPAAPSGATSTKVDVKALAGEDAKAPWHFKLLMAAVVGYLAWRLLEIVVWLVERL